VRVAAAMERTRWEPTSGPGLPSWAKAASLLTFIIPGMPWVGDLARNVSESGDEWLQAGSIGM
jgi:hypothetical protein